MFDFVLEDRSKFCSENINYAFRTVEIGFDV